MWNQIKNEYITDFNATYKSLALKYDINISAIGKRGTREGWFQERKQFQRQQFLQSQKDKYAELKENQNAMLSVDTEPTPLQEICNEMEEETSKTQNHPINPGGMEMTKRAFKMHSVADKLLSRIEDILDRLPLEDIIKDTQYLKHIVSMLKDIKDIQMIKSDSDMREQEAKIRNLEKQAGAEEKDTTVTVKFEENIGKWSK